MIVLDSEVGFWSGLFMILVALVGIGLVELILKLLRKK